MSNTRAIFGLSEKANETSTPTDTRSIFGLDNKPKSKGIFSKFGDLYDKLGEEFDWFKKMKGDVSSKFGKIDYSKKDDQPEIDPFGNRSYDPRESLDITGSFVGSPLALAETGASALGAGAASRFGALSRAGRAAQLTNRGISAGSAVAQVPKFAEAMREGETGTAVGTGLGIGMGILGARGVPKHPDQLPKPKGKTKSFTLMNPSERNLADLEEQGFKAGAVVNKKGTKKPQGQMMFGDDMTTPEVTENVKNKVTVPYVRGKVKVAKKLIKDETGKPVLDADGKKQYETVKKRIPSEDFATVFQRWAFGRRSADYSSANVKNQFKDLDDKPLFQDVGNGPEVNEANLKQALTRTKDYFNKKYAQLVGAGKKLGYREDYIPQMWDNSKDEVDAVFGSGNSRLALKKGFEFQRVLENYKEGIEKGLTPKFSSMSDLAAFYEKHADKAIEDINFFNYLRESGKITTKQSRDRIPLPESLFPVKRGPKGDISPWYADKETHDAIVGFLENKEPGMIERAGQFLKTSALAAGVPKTALNFHGISVTARDALASDKPLQTLVKDIKLLVNPSAGEKFIRDNLKHIADAVRDGLQMSTEHIPFRVGVESGKKGFVGWSERIFEDPLFQKALPAMKLERYDSIRADLIAKGLDRAEAGRLAAQQTNTIFGSIDFKTMVSDKKFDKRMKFLFDKNGSWFLAPQWLASQGYIAKDAAKALLNPNDPRGRVYHQVAKNLGVAYTYANVTNKILSGHWMGENDHGKFFEIDTGQTDENGKKIYIAPFGTGVDFVRLPIEIASKVLSGDSQGVASMGRGRLGPMAQIGLSGLTGEDWRGKPIDGPLGYAGLGIDYLPPYVKASGKLFDDKQSIFQTLSEGVEAPVRFRKPESRFRF